ncbi:MAG TPA: oligosaccharide flippase family protein [Firmicutes bacterium]|nr:oligosaccharide flippase family protein [Bacillota bacterium]
MKRRVERVRHDVESGRLDAGSSRFARGALLLALAGGFSRFLGVFYLIPLPRLIGEAGMGLWQMAAAWQGLLLVLASGGLQVALARLVAEARGRREWEREERLLQVAMGMASITGLLGALALAWLGPAVAGRLQGDEGVIQVIKAFAPSVFLLTMASVLRGYFQGRQALGVTAASEVIEQVFRVGTMLLLGAAWAPAGPGPGARGAALGASAGGAAALALLGTALLWRGRTTGMPVDRGGQSRDTAQRRRGGAQRPHRRLGHTLVELWRDAPAGVALALVNAGVQAAAATAIPYRLRRAGVPVETVRELYGQYGLAVRMVGVPGFISHALGSALLPAVARDRAGGHARFIARRSEQAVRLLFLLGVPAATGMAVLAEPLASLLFGLPGVAVPLRSAAPGVAGTLLFQATTGILQGLGLVYRPAVHLGLAGILQMALVWWWVGARAGRERALVGAGGAAAVSWMVAALLNLLWVVRRTGMTVSVAEMVVRPLLASGIMAVFVSVLHPYLLALPAGEAVPAPLAGVVAAAVWQQSLWPGVVGVAAVAGGVVSYFLALILLGGMGSDERRWLQALRGRPA